MGLLRLFCDGTGASGIVDFPQLRTSSLNRSRMVVADGRFEGWEPCSTDQVLSNNSHSRSENPECGLSGRPPSRTLYITVTSPVVLSNGRHPAITYTDGRKALRCMKVAVRKHSPRKLSYLASRYPCSLREAASCVCHQQSQTCRDTSPPVPSIGSCPPLRGYRDCSQLSIH